MNRHFSILCAAAALEGGGGAPKESPEQKIARLEKENAELKARPARAELPDGVRERMASGLTREQAEHVEEQQALVDKHVAAKERERKEAAVAAAKGGKQ